LPGPATVKVRLKDLEAVAPNRPAGYLAEVLARGSTQGPWVVLSGAAYQELRAKFSAFQGMRLRPPADQAGALAICRGCEELTADGRCRVCRSCGGLRRVADWVRLAHHGCPKGRW
jgi:hypothetical protein